jgi:hypothetical protein
LYKFTHDDVLKNIATSSCNPPRNEIPDSIITLLASSRISHTSNAQFHGDSIQPTIKAQGDIDRLGLFCAASGWKSFSAHFMHAHANTQRPFECWEEAFARQLFSPFSPAIISGMNK